MTDKPSVNLDNGARHRNGDRYNSNHHFINYEVTGYYLVKGELIEMKTDGPNHSGCSSLPRCQWAEPRLVLSNGKAEIASEYPHPTNHGPFSCSSCKTLAQNFEGKWIGYKVIAYTDPADGFRIYEQWVDPDGLTDSNTKPVNNWVLTLKEKNTGQIMPNPNRQLPIEGRGLEAEIRIHGGHGTEMKMGTVHEIIPPTAK
jgi:hypothetical protein